MNNKVCSNNYRMVTESKEKFLVDGCPVLVESATLLQSLVDGKYYVRCVFEGLVESRIETLFIDVILRASGKEIARVENFKYEFEGTTRNAQFGQTVGIPVEAETDADSIEVVPKKAVLEDGGEALAKGSLIKLTTQATLIDYFGDAEIASEYAIEANISAEEETMLVPEKIGKYWLCTCGNINHSDERNCQSCGNEAETLFDKLDAEALIENLETRKAEEARIHEEQRIRAEEARARAKKRAKIAAIISIIVIILTVGSYLFATKALPAIRYNSACNALDSGDYEKAYTTFAKLDGYDDSDAKYTESYYQYGLTCLEEGDYDRAMEVFTEIKQYRESKDMLKKAKYQSACELLDEDKYEDAAAAFSTLGKYEDSQKKKLKAMYGYVGENKDRTNETTYKYLKELKAASYKDAASIFKKLYAWEAKMVINNEEKNADSAKKSISKYDKIYCHVTLEGGEPGANTKLKYKAVYPNGSAATGSWGKKWKEKTSGQCAFWYDIPEYGVAGTFTIYIYDANTGKQIGKGSVELTN